MEQSKQISNSPQDFRFCVYTRSFHENPYLDFFIEYYVKLGFERIFILKGDEIRYQPPPEYAKNTRILTVLNLANKLLPKYDYLIKKKYDWTLVIDIDEFLMLPKEYQSIQSYVTSRLKINSQINVFYFRWGMIEKYDQDVELTFKEILTKYKIFSNHHIKSLVLNKALKQVSHPHICSLRNPVVCYFEGNIIDSIKPDSYPISKTSYKDGFLIHLHTRSLNNIVIKSHYTRLTHGKKIKHKKQFFQLISNTEIDKNQDKLANSLSLFKESIGLKATLPYNHSKYPLISFNDKDVYLVNENSTPINVKLEQLEHNYYLRKYKINQAKYYYFMNQLSELVLNEKKFIH